MEVTRDFFSCLKKKTRKGKGKESAYLCVKSQIVELTQQMDN